MVAVTGEMGPDVSELYSALHCIALHAQMVKDEEEEDGNDDDDDNAEDDEGEDGEEGDGGEEA